MRKDVVKQKYDSFKDYISGEEGNGCSLATTLEEFQSSVDEERELGIYEAYILIPITIMCGCCGKPYTKKFRYFKQGKKVCGECSARLFNGAGQRLSKSVLIERIEAKGLKFIKSDYKNETSIITVQCRCGCDINTSYASIRNSSELFLCPDCNNKRMRNHFKYDFNHLVEKFEKNGCKILTEEHEYVNCKEQVKIIARCGHEHKASIDSFFSTKYKMCHQCTREMNSGESTYNWKGGIYSSENEKFRKTYEFKYWQKSVLKRDGYTYQLCNQVGVRLNSHHLDGYNWAIDKRTELDNGITLCEECHKEFHMTFGYGDNTKEQFQKFVNTKGHDIDLDLTSISVNKK